MLAHHFKTLCLLVVALASSVCADADDKPVDALASSIKPLKSLLVTGGCCHDYDIQKDLIAKGLWQRAHIDVTVVRQGGSAAMDVSKSDAA